MTDQLPAIIDPCALTPLPSAHLIPTLIAAAGDQASWRYVDFFTASIRNPNTRPGLRPRLRNVPGPGRRTRIVPRR